MMAAAAHAPPLRQFDTTFHSVAGGGVTKGRAHHGGGGGGGPTRLGLQQYMAAKARETARAWREAQEWRRRLRASTHAWSETVSVQGDLQRRLTEERSAARRPPEQQLRRVTERDGRLAALQHELTAIARMDLPLESNKRGSGSGHGHGGDLNDNLSASSRASKRRQRAAETLRDHMVKMQSEDRARAAQLLDIMQGVAPELLGYGGGGGGGGVNKDKLLSSVHDTANAAGVVVASEREVSKLRGRVAELQDQVTELEQQGGRARGGETMELVEGLQEELAALQDSHARLERNSARPRTPRGPRSSHPTARAT